jgi:uncharacterized protein YdhG (YjbR/CyaY superfamily)
MGDVDAYLTDQPAEVRASLQHLADLVLEVAPDAERGTSYGAPAFRWRGRPLLGFTVAKGHLSLFVFSPAVIERVADRLAGLSVTKGTVRFTPDHPVPDDVVRDMVRFRLEEISA